MQMTVIRDEAFPSLGVAIPQRKMIGLPEYKNVNYLLVIKRILGMEPIRE